MNETKVMDNVRYKQFHSPSRLRLRCNESANLTYKGTILNVTEGIDTRIFLLSESCDIFTPMKTKIENHN